MTNNPPSSRIQPRVWFSLKLKPRYDNFIGGDWVAPVDGEYYSNLTPVTGQPLCEIASSGKRDIDLALDAAHKAKDKWGTNVRSGQSGHFVQNRRSDGAESGAAGDRRNVGQRQADPGNHGGGRAAGD